jgi:exopolysaccharide biosynthesis polyprenyl glycosylphosphotransferase
MSRLQFVYFFIVGLALLLGYRALLRIAYRLGRRPRPGWSSRILILGAGELGRRIAAAVRERGRWGYSLVGFLDDEPSVQTRLFEEGPVLGTLADVKKVVAAERVEELWIALPPRAYERTKEVIAEAETLPLRIKIVPDYLSLAMVRARVDLLGGIPLIGLREPLVEGSPRMIKRMMDIAVSSICLLLAAPWMALIAAAIRLETAGPIIIRQERVGENGRLFEMLKFRTMVSGAGAAAPSPDAAPQAGDAAHKRRADPRVTRVGRLLRRFSLDELPQFVNVLRAEMSLVGPRPELPWLVDAYQPWQRKRFAVPQGMTGWWQISGRSDKPMHLNTEDDLYYVYNYSIWVDLLILLRTPFAVLLGKGAF